MDGAGRSEAYVALSYSWGGESATMLTSSTVVQFRRMIPPEALPPTVSDAITFTRALGIRYIWIDALYIFQDSPEDFMLDMGNMRAIYRGATVTVQESNAGKVSHPLFHPRQSRQVKIQWRRDETLTEHVYLRESSNFTR